MTSEQKPQQPAQESQIIPAQGNGVTELRLHAFLAVMTGLILRLLFVLQFPASSGDSDTYLQLAHNWTDHHVLGLWLNGHLVPTDLRMPGYPAFLAAVSLVLGRSIRAVLLSQVAIDLCTCFLTAGLAMGLAPAKARRQVGIAGLWLAATCPFVANYASVVLTEVLVTFLGTAALVCFIWGLHRKIPPLLFASVGACVTGVATLVRPEMPLLLIAAALVYAFRWWRLAGFRKMLFYGLAMAGAFVLPLIPWAARNFITLHKAQILAPRYVTLPGEYAPVGYYAWTRTWLERYRDVYLSVWKIGEEPVDINDLPSNAYDSPQELARIAVLFDQYNKSDDLDISPEMDREFAEIARERARRDPLRTYVRVPFQRALSIWFTPRTENLPIDGKLWPLRDQWQDSQADVLATAGFAALGYLYVAFAMGGIWEAWRSGRKDIGASDSQDEPIFWGVILVVLYLLIRTAFLTTVEAPEPRYVIPCYPALLAIAALVFDCRQRKHS